MNNVFPEPIYRIGVMRTTKAWRLRKGRYRLLGTKCNQCGQTWWPGKKVCACCNSTDVSDYEFTHYGKLENFHYGPMVWHLDPVQGFNVYGLDRILADVKLDDEQGTFVAPTEVVDCRPQDAEDGMELEMVLRKLRREPNGNWNYGYMWIPRDPDVAE